MQNSVLFLTKHPFPSPNPNIRMYLVTYLSDGLRVKALLAEPDDDRYYDGFLYLRGGIKNVGMVRPARIGQFASEGFIVLAPFYRGNRGGEGNEDFAGHDRSDAISACQVLQAYSRTTGQKVHVFGFSRGGVMALLTGITCSEVASVVTWGGVSDMFLTYEERQDLRRMMKRVIGGTPKKFPERYRARTPLYQLEKLDAPVLIIHGCKDEHVSVEHAYRLENHLQQLKKPVESWYYPTYTHYFPPVKNRMIVQALCQWMKQQSYENL